MCFIAVVLSVNHLSHTLLSFVVKISSAVYFAIFRCV